MGPPMCFGLCPSPDEQCEDTGDGCSCVPTSTTCGGGSAPQCDGACPPDSFCGDAGGFCTCFQVGCGQFQPWPICGGVCPPNNVCADVETGVCACVPENGTN